MKHFKKILTVFFLTVSAYLPAEDTLPVVKLDINPEIPTAGQPWTLIITAYHSVPEEITVIAPPFAGFLYLDRIIKQPRYIGAEIQTVIEYRFIPNRSGHFVLESFIINSPAGIVETSPLIINILPEIAMESFIVPQIVWETNRQSPSGRQMAVGERLTITLRVTTADSLSGNLQLPPQEFFAPEVPRGVILALNPLTADERAGGAVLKFTLIPLEAGDFYLPARILYNENIRFEIPALQINIR
jgi:hypothetical protein